MALARRWPWTIPLSALLYALLSPSLKATTSYSRKNHVPLSIQYHPPSATSFNIVLTLFFHSFSLLIAPFLPWNLCLVSHLFLFASALLVIPFGDTKTNVLNQGEVEHDAPHIFLGSGFSGPCLTLPLPHHQNVGDSPCNTMSHPNHLSIFEKALMDFYCLKGLGPNPGTGWTKQLLL